MADNEQIARLKASVGDWNAWRAANPRIKPDLSGADLTGADLAHADLIEADLSRSVLRRAALTGALMLGARLRGADLHLTDLRGADLRGADMSGAALAESIYLVQSQVESAGGNEQTTLPPKLQRPAHWARKRPSAKR